MEEVRTGEEGIVVPEGYFAFICQSSKNVYVLLKQFTRISEVIAAQIDLGMYL